MDWSLLSNKDSELKDKYLNFFTTATDTLTLHGKDSEIVAFAIPVEISKTVIDDLLYTWSKLKIQRSREFLKLSVIGLHQNTTNLKPSPIDSHLSSLDVYKAVEPNITVHDINLVLNVIYKLDEQLWCKSVYGASSDELVKLFTSVSRPYSAFDRLSTFVSQDQSLHYLAEYGYVYRGDDVLMNVYNENEIKTIKPNCIDKISETLLLQNNVNVKLEDSLNYLPPVSLGKVNKIVTSDSSDLLITFSDTGV